MLGVSASPISMLADEMEKKRWLADDTGSPLTQGQCRVLPFNFPAEGDCLQVAWSVGILHLQVTALQLTHSLQCCYCDLCTVHLLPQPTAILHNNAGPSRAPLQRLCHPEFHELATHGHDHYGTCHRKFAAACSTFLGALHKA